MHMSHWGLVMDGCMHWMHGWMACDREGRRYSFSLTQKCDYVGIGRLHRHLAIVAMQHLGLKVFAVAAHPLTRAITPIPHA